MVSDFWLGWGVCSAFLWVKLCHQTAQQRQLPQWSWIFHWIKVWIWTVPAAQTQKSSLPVEHPPTRWQHLGSPYICSFSLLLWWSWSCSLRERRWNLFLIWKKAQNSWLFRRNVLTKQTIKQKIKQLHCAFIKRDGGGKKSKRERKK